MNDELLARSTSWSRYWSSGAENSCAGSYAGAYGESIAAFWRDGFKALPSGARVLDLGTGNGPLPKILLGLASRTDLQCDAIDLANIAPAWFADLPTAVRSRVRFHSACRMEKLPFASSTFDMVVSQWGLEYSNLETSVAELLRVLVPGGRVQFLIHHTGALPVVLAGHEVAHLDWLESESGYLDVVAQMVEPMAIAATPEGRGRLALDPHAHDLKEAFNFQQDAIQLRIDRTDCTDVLFDVRQFVGTLFLIAQRHGFLAASSALQKIRAELADSRLRLSELIQHAMDRAAVNVLATSLAVGGEYHVDELRDQDAIMSWSLVASPQLPSG